MTAIPDSALTDASFVNGGAKPAGSPIVEKLSTGLNPSGQFYSGVFDKNNVGRVLVCFANNTNVSCIATIEAGLDADFTEVWTLANPVTLADGISGSYLVTEPWPFIRVNTTPASSATGSFDIYVTNAAGRDRY